MKYDHQISITLPVALADIAAAIGRAMDYDTGGDKSFMLSEDGLTINVTTPCTEVFYMQVQAMLANPALLYTAVAQDYATRWTEFTAPTLEQCQQFVAGIIPPQGQ